MKVYFTAAVSNVSDDIRIAYKKIITALENQGHSVIYSASLLSGKLVAQNGEDVIANQRKLSQWKKQADIVLVEGTTPSFGVGQEITEALADNKQVVVLHYIGKKPHLLVNQGQESIYFAEYTVEKINSVIEDYIEYAREHSDTRFNFFISPQIGTYLDWVSKSKRIPRAVYLRKLIENDMRGNKEYNEE